MVGSRQRVAMIYRGVMRPRESEKVGLRTGGGFGAILARAVHELEHELAVVGVLELVGERAVPPRIPGVPSGCPPRKSCDTQ